MTNICFHIEYRLSDDISAGQAPQLQSRFPVSPRHDTAKLLVMLARNYCVSRQDERGDWE